MTNLSFSATNASFPAGPFSFIIPYSQTQQCDIYGPICQTGSITVGVDLTSITTTATFPCSSYLTAQAAYLSSFQPNPGAIFPFWPGDWDSGFGHSPECKSYAEVWQRGGQYTISNCGSSDTVIQAAAPSDGIALPTQVPPGVLRAIPATPHEVYECCGNCSLNVPEVRLYYFPDNATPLCERNQTTNSTAVIFPREIDRRVQSLIQTGSIAVLSGHTLYVRCFDGNLFEAYLDDSTSPSVYLQIVGTAAVTDQCGPLGSTLTNPIITLAPDVLSTYLPYSYEIGSTYMDDNGYPGDMFLGIVKPLKISDLQCPTFGIGISTNADGSMHTTVGPPWLPVIVPPQQAFSLEPSWESLCTGLLSFAPGMISFAIFDPPRALSPVSNLVAPPPDVPLTTAPSNVLVNPTATLDPPAIGSENPSIPPSSPVESIAPPSGNSPGSQGPSKAQTGPNAAKPAAVPLDPAAKPTMRPGPPNQSPSTPQNGNDLQTESQGIGALIFSALGKTAPPASGNADPVSIVQVPRSGIKEVTVGGQILLISPSGVILGGKTYSIGGPAISLSSGVISLISASSSGEAPQNEDYILPVPASGVKELTVGDQVLSISPSGASLDGTLYSVGGPAISLPGGVVSLISASTGGDSPENEGYIIPVPKSGVKQLTVGDQVLSISPSGIVLDGTSYSVGGPAISLPGGVVSLAPSNAAEKSRDNNDNPSTNNQPLTSNIQMIAGQAVVSTLSGLVIGGSKLFPGGSPITVSNTVISLSPSSILVVGSSSVTLSPQSMFAVGHFLSGVPSAGFVVDGSIGTVSAGGHPITVDGIAVQVESTAIVIDGITLQPGGTGAIVDGSSVSLEQGGTLVIGSAPFAMPTELVNGTSTLQAFEGSQDRACGLSWSFLYLALSVSGIWVIAS